MIKYKKKYIYRERGIFMSFTLGNPIAVSTNFIKSNPAVPVYKGTEEPDNCQAERESKKIKTIKI